MNEKVNVELILPEIEERYNVLLPINKRIGTIVLLLNKAINELTYGDYELSRANKLYNAVTLKLYQPSDILYNTDIRNGTKLILFSK